MKLLMSFLCIAFAGEAGAQSLIALKTLQPGDLISNSNITISSNATLGALKQPEDAIGLEVQRAIFSGQPIMATDLRAPRLVRRNELVTLIYQAGNLDIRTEGRSLSDGSEGELIQVMNLESKTRLTGVILESGLVDISKGR